MQLSYIFVFAPVILSHPAAIYVYMWGKIVHDRMFVNFNDRFRVFMTYQLWKEYCWLVKNFSKNHMAIVMVGYL